MFKESEWSDWNEALKNCSENTKQDKTFVVPEPQHTCNNTTNGSVLAAGVCLGEEKKHTSQECQFALNHNFDLSKSWSGSGVNQGGRCRPGGRGGQCGRDGQDKAKDLNMR